MKAFFDSLFESTGTIQCSNNHNDSNSQSTPLPIPNPMTMDQPISHSLKHVTLSNYLNCLHMADCYISTRLMHCCEPIDHQNLQLHTQQHTLMMSNRYELHRDHQNFGAHQHVALSNIKSVPYPPINGVPPTHLDWPLDQHQPLCTITIEHLAPDSTISQPDTRRTRPMIYHHGLILCYNPANSCPLPLSFTGNIRIKHNSAVALAAQHSVARFAEKHDLQPP